MGTKTLAALGAVTAALWLSACNAETVSPTATTPKPVASTAPGTIDGDGVLTVGADIKPGRYTSLGPAEDSGGNCYWARLKATDGELESVIANGNTSGKVTVTIKRTDKAFETQGCLPWRPVK